MGGESHPILTAVLGVAAGAASAGAGFIFTAATTALSYANITSNVRARPGDEIWHLEEIGKTGHKPMYVSAFYFRYTQKAVPHQRLADP